MAALWLGAIGLGLLILPRPVHAGIWDENPAKCAQGNGWSNACVHRDGAQDRMAAEPNQWVTVETDSDSPISVRYRMSRTPGDIDCDRAQENSLTMNDRFQVTAKRPYRFYLNFLRQQKPGTALYEWHVCFLIDGTVYRAWQGYDPGPGATLKIDCEIDTDQLKAKNTDLYLCPDVELKANRDDYREYAMHCDGKACRRFESREDYVAWHRFNPLPDTVQDAMAVAVLDYESAHTSFLSQKGGGICLSVRDADPTPALLAAAAGSGFQIQPASQCSGGLKVSLGNFTATAANSAQAVLQTRCGPDCGARESYTLKKTGKDWKVVGYRMGSSG